LAKYFTRTLLAALAWKADVYHAHNANTLPIAYAAAALRGARLVYDAHELETGRCWSNTNLSPLIRKLWALPERLFIGSSDGIITVCQSIARELEQSYQIRAPHVVRNVPKPLDSLQPVDIRSRVGLEHNVAIVIYQGGISRDRGIHELIEAITTLDNAALVILGAGPGLASLQATVARKGLTDRVFFLGRVPLENLPRYTAAADVGVHVIQNSCLNHFYCLPNKLFEYVQAGLPVVVSNFPEMARIVRKYELGEVVDPSNPNEIAAAIHRILNDDNYRQRLRQSALEAAKDLNWGQEGKRLLEIYEALEKRQT